LAVASVAALAQTAIVIRDVTLIDMTRPTARASMTIVVEGDRISMVGRGIRTPKNAKVIDGRGKFLIPGLWDMHVHALSPDRVETFFKLFIANGVTGIRDTGTTAEGFAMLDKIRGEISSGKMV